MTDLWQQCLLREIAHDVVRQIAPHEIPVFRAISAAYFEDPRKVLKNPQQKDDMLGFGVETAVVFLTPAVLAVLTEVFKFLLDIVKTSVKEEGTEILAEAMKNMFKKFHSPIEHQQPARTALSPAQLKQVHQRVLETSHQLHVAEDKATLLAAAVVGCLAAGA